MNIFPLFDKLRKKSIKYNLVILFLGSLLISTSCSTLKPITNDSIHSIDMKVKDILNGDVKNLWERDEQEKKTIMASISCDHLVANLRKELETVLPAKLNEKEANSLFEFLPQGTRMFFGIRRSDRRFLSQGVLTIHPYSSNAVNIDHSFRDLERNLAALKTLKDEVNTSDQSPYRDGELADSKSIRLFCKYIPDSKEQSKDAQDKEVLYEKLLEVVRKPGAINALYIVALQIPYSLNDKKNKKMRVATYGFYFVQNTPSSELKFKGHDFIDVHYRNARVEQKLKSIGWFFQSPIMGPFLRIPNDMFFQDSALAAMPLNFPANVGVNVFISLKECAFEFVKFPFILSSSFLTYNSNNPFGEFLRHSLWAPFESMPEIWSHHITVVKKNSCRTSWLSHLWDAFTAIPFAGPYFTDYLNDPWSNYAESPPRPNFEKRPLYESWKVRNAPPKPQIYLSRGIHGGNYDEQGNEIWKRFIKQSLKDAGIKEEININQAPYEYGTVIDVFWGLMGLSNGPGYVMANQVEERLEDINSTRVVTMLAHSGGVQRATAASRLLWRRDIFTDRLYGAAGPAVGLAPTKPRAYGIVLNVGEFKDADITSQFSRVVGSIERFLVKPFEIPVVGLIWLFSAPSKGYYESVLNADIYRTGEGESFTHHNPGLITGRRRDSTLQYFQGELGHLIRADRILRTAYLRTRTEGDCKDYYKDREPGWWERPIRSTIGRLLQKR